MWEYIYKQIKDVADLNHKVIIITDGEDNGSPPPFNGLGGFNELMRRLRGRSIRISVLLVGDGLSKDIAAQLHDLSLAMGGVFHHSSTKDALALALQDFVAPLLLPEAQRDMLAVSLGRVRPAVGQLDDRAGGVGRTVVRSDSAGGPPGSGRIRPEFDKIWPTFGFGQDGPSVFGPPMGGGAIVTLERLLSNIA